MPQITTDAGILAAARNAINILLRFKGQTVTLRSRGTPERKPSGGNDYWTGDEGPELDPPAIPPFVLGDVIRDPQVLSLSKIGDDIVGTGENDEQRYVVRNYALTGRYDMDIAVNDTWQDDEADYRVDSVDQTSGFKTSAVVIGFVKVAE